MKHSEKTKQLIRQKTIEQFKNGMPQSTINNMKKGHKKRVLATIGHTFINRGYIWIKIGNRKYVGQHRVIVEQYLERKLKKNELIHHIDGNKINNQLSNLYIFTNKAVHFAFEILIKYQYLPQICLKSNLKEIKEKENENEMS